jgi:hypothetical protein
VDVDEMVDKVSAEFEGAAGGQKESVVRRDGCTVLVGRTPEQQGREDDEGKGGELLLMQRVISVSLG